jgi:Flp pilus assembly protein TadG
MRKSRSGQVTLEIVVILIAIIILLFFVVDVCLLSFNWLGMQFSVTDGARYGAMSSTATDADVEGRVVATASAMGVSGVTADADVSGDIVRVSAVREHTFFPLFSLLVSGTGSESFNMVVRAERTKEIS